jgi:hypothetical protein
MQKFGSPSWPKQNAIPLNLRIKQRPCHVPYYAFVIPQFGYTRVNVHNLNLLPIYRTARVP